MTGLTREYLKTIESYLGKGGVLSRELPGYEYRHEQISMAEAVLKTLTDHGILMVEAGTGTGKTLSYLLPTIISNQRVVIFDRHQDPAGADFLQRPSSFAKLFQVQGRDDERPGQLPLLAQVLQVFATAENGVHG